MTAGAVPVEDGSVVPRPAVALSMTDGLQGVPREDLLKVSEGRVLKVLTACRQGIRNSKELGDHD